MPAVLGYWNIRGLAEPIRYLLHYLEIEFEDRRYEFGDEPHFFDCPWMLTEKAQLDLKFPNLPYYIDGELKITQSLVIMRHLARKSGSLYLPTSNDESILTFEMVEGHVRDIQNDLARIAHSPLFAHERIMFAYRFRGQLEAVVDFLADKEWMMGQLSHIDFILFESLDVLEQVYPGICLEFDHIVRYRERFCDLAPVKAYRENSAKWPIFTPFAFFGWKSCPLENDEEPQGSEV